MTVLKGKLVSTTVYESSRPVQLRFELTNSGDKDLYVLKWFTPLEGLNSDYLRVMRNGKTRVDYDGPMIKRGQPSEHDFLLIPAGETVSNDVDVSESYAVAKPADYHVELNIPALEYIRAPQSGEQTDALMKSTHMLLPVSGGKTKFKVAKGSSQLTTRGAMARKASKALKKSTGTKPSAGTVAVAAGALPPSFTGGTSSQQTEAKQAHDDGFQLCVKAIGTLSNDTKYKKWFGVHTPTRFRKVKSVYTKIRKCMQTKTFTYDLAGIGNLCAVDDGYIAYTYKKVQLFGFVKDIGLCRPRAWIQKRIP